MRIGVDLGGTSIKAGLVDDNGIIINRVSAPTRAGSPYAEICNDIEKLILQAADGAKITGIGMGSPGKVDSVNGVVLKANNFKHSPLPFQRELSAWFPSIPIKIDNDASCAALAENLYGAAKGVKLAILLTLGTGVGCGIVQNGKIWRGNDNLGGEIGHMNLQVGGEPCTCGRKGCLEAYASATALIRDTKRRASKGSAIYEAVGGDLDKIDAKLTFDLAKSGDSTCMEIVDNYIQYLAEGIGNIAFIFNPNRILIGGGVGGEGQWLTKRLSALVREIPYITPPEIEPASLGNKAGIIGAAALNLPGKIRLKCR